MKGAATFVYHVQHSTTMMAGVLLTKRQHSDTGSLLIVILIM